MRQGRLSIAMAALLAVAACQPAAQSSPSAAASASPSAAPTTAASSAPPASGGAAADTLQMHWLGDLTAIWHPASQETFSQAVNFQLMFDKLIDRKWKDDGSGWEPAPDLADSWTRVPLRRGQGSDQ